MSCCSRNAGSGGGGSGGDDGDGNDPRKRQRLMKEAASKGQNTIIHVETGVETVEDDDNEDDPRSRPKQPRKLVAKSGALPPPPLSTIPEERPPWDDWNYDHAAGNAAGGAAGGAAGDGAGGAAGDAAGAAAGDGAGDAAGDDAEEEGDDADEVEYQEDWTNTGRTLGMRTLLFILREE